ncbi:hypothetical protein ATANTOWER_017512 [Ataeniobius toweri]|uniref:Uncharacterized protein n=1 Tax=Ataeniobius toweri TaxID=208326 RepID=A0ABU7BH74_9TELE|nr:hypothetical protein [Ataeniobius toweri]
MTCRTGQQSSLPDLRNVPNPMDQLTLSCMGCVSSAPESRTSRRAVSLTYKSAGRHACCSLFLDPYDGSSEDSDESNSGTSRQMRHHHGNGGGGGYSLSGQRRQLFLHHSASLTVSEMVTNSMRDSSIHHQSVVHKDANEVQMKYGSDSELWDCGLASEVKECKRTPEGGVSYSTKDIHAMDVEVQLDDSGLDGTRSPTCCTTRLHTLEDRSSSQMLSSCLERSLRPLCKRKAFPPGAELVEAEPRKRQCVKNMEDEREGAG